MTVRAFVYSLVANDIELNQLGYSGDNGYSGWSPESPPGDLFWVLRWGQESAGVAGARGRGKVTARTVALWAYDRQENFDRINACLKRWQDLLDALEATRTGGGSTDGWVTSTAWEGDSDDAFDDIYNAQVRSSSYTIIASGD
jgi:hypothetical protein